MVPGFWQRFGEKGRAISITEIIICLLRFYYMKKDLPFYYEKVILTYFSKVLI
jgi:hypothetical protein